MADPAPQSPVSFTFAAAQQIVETVRLVQGRKTSKATPRNANDSREKSFWAFLSSPGGLSGLFWSWVRVQPVQKFNMPTPNDPFTIDQNIPLWEFTDPPVAGYQNARESSNNQQVVPGSVVKLEMIGEDKDGEPVYVFQWQLPPQLFPVIPIHDHRDAFNGGFSFSCFHPGTALPQVPWAI